jgi:hypothetical protein
MRAKILDVNNLLWLALALALAGSLKHLAAIFASVDGNLFMGWLQAIAIDTGLFALAYSIRVRKVAKRSVKAIWFGVVVFTGISVYGNLAYGLLATNGSLPAWIVASKPVVLAASLPILVLFLSELLSDDRQHAVKEAKKAAKKSKLPPSDPDIGKANEARVATKEERKRQLAALHQQKPDANITELATLLDVSRGTIRNYAGELGIELATSGNGRGA